MRTRAETTHEDYLRGDLTEGLRALLYESGYKPSNVLFLNTADEEFPQWLRDNHVDGRYVAYTAIDVKCSNAKIYDCDRKSIAFYIPDDNQYILTKMRWS